MSNRTRLVWLFLFAVAMAQVEAAVVLHLRTIYYPGYPPRVFPLELLSYRDLAVELVREAATMAMILAVAMLSVRGFVRVFAAFVFVFGVWDVFYYVWLKLMGDWPAAWGEWDVLFLIPWPWVGPWLTPVAVALLFVAWGARVLGAGGTYRVETFPAGCLVVGVVLVLASFLSPTAVLLPGGPAAFAGYVPGAFPWALYLPGLALMALGLWRVLKTERSAADAG